MRLRTIARNGRLEREIIDFRVLCPLLVRLVSKQRAYGVPMLTLKRCGEEYDH